MSELKIEVGARVEETFNALRHAPYDAQERACQSVAERHGEEAARKLRELFEAEHAKVRRLVEKAGKAIADLPTLKAEDGSGFAARMKEEVKVEAEAFFKKPEPQPIVEPRSEPEPPRKAAVGTFRRRTLGPPQVKPVEEIVRPTLNEEIAKLEVDEKKALVSTGQLVTPGMAAQKPVVALNEMNKRHAVITNLGGKCVVMEWVPSELNPEWEEPSYQSFTAFRERYANRYVEIITDVTGKVQKIGAEPLAGWWLCQPGRRQYEGLGLEPNGLKVLADHRLNLWRGFGVVPKEGDWSRLRKHLRVVLASEEKRSEEYIVKWTAWKVQNPGETPEVALAFRGKKGVGKGVWMYALLKVFGPHGLQIYNREHLTGKHNKHLQNRLLLCADEAVWAGDKEAERVLKGMVTEKTLTIEPKGIDAFPWRNPLGIVMSTNDKWVVPASWDERRYAVFEVNPIYSKRCFQAAAFSAAGDQPPLSGPGGMLV
jgi:hypothetical protein